MKNDIYKTSRICYIIEETSAYLISLLITGAYLAKLTLSLGFSDSLTAILSSCVNLGFIFQLFAISVFRHGYVKRKVTVFYTLNELLFVLLYVTPIVDIDSGVKTVLFIAFLLGGYILLNIAVSPKNCWYMTLVPDENRGRFTAFKEAVSLLCGIVFSFYMGILIDHYEKTGNTRDSFIACSIVMLVLMVTHTLSLIVAKEKAPEDTEEISFLGSMREILCDKNTLSVIVLSSLWAVCLAFSSPFFGTYEVKELGFSMTFIALLSMISAIARVVASIFLGRYADKTSFSKMLRICYLLVAVSFLATTFTVPSNGYIMFSIYSVFMAAAMGGINSAEINLVFDCVSPEKRRNTLSVKNTFCGLFGFCSTLMATPLLQWIQNNGLTIFGINVYAQQVLSFVSFVLTLILILYVTKLINRQE